MQLTPQWRLAGTPSRFASQSSVQASKQATSAWSVKTRRAPSRHCRDAKGLGRVTRLRPCMTMNTPPPPPAPCWSEGKTYKITPSALTWWPSRSPLLSKRPTLTPHPHRQPPPPTPAQGRTASLRITCSAAAKLGLSAVSHVSSRTSPTPCSPRSASLLPPKGVASWKAADPGASRAGAEVKSAASPSMPDYL